ncbi:unnamed protein product [Cylindrotheca closterium]|uniref:Protein-serine/threonine kinase n=1 Tax=Cylindrotheca closterium TaxID=2856 RepID=A0AAD2JKQ0_9STRA|nr:unnamed protein product [Cylindrotheca closterium]
MRTTLLRRLHSQSPSAIAMRGVHHNRLSRTSSSSRSSSSSLIQHNQNNYNNHEISDLIHEYASKKQTTISLKDMMLMNSVSDTDHYQAREKRVLREQMLMQMATMLQEELPIRLAHRIQDLDSLAVLQEMPSVQQVRSTYLSSFLDLLDQPKPSSPQAEQDFGRLLQNLYQNHSNVLRQMARGVLELRFQQVQQQYPVMPLDHDHGLSMVDEAFLDRFYMSRVGIRVLAGQYLALRHQLLNDPLGKSIPKEYVGMINRKTSPSRVVQRAIEDATLLCHQQFGPGQAPKVQVSGKMQLTFCYIPTHLHYILLELIKNSMRATMEYHKDSEEKPPIRVVIADGTENEDVIIKVSDQGGGIPRSEMSKIWSYLFTTASPKVQQEFFNATKQLNGAIENGSVLAGLGYGLPLSRAYSRYFGGDLDLMSMEGYGTDAFCHLVRLADKAPLPV